MESFAEELMEELTAETVFTIPVFGGIAVCRRAGATGAFDDLNKYFTIAQMPVVSSQYWNMVFGTTPEEIRRDAEGMQTMRTLARNMTWLLKCIDAGRAAGILPPEPEKQIRTNFIR